MLELIFGTYYGLDWASMALGFWGAWIVGNRNPKGFLLICISVTFAFATALIADQYGFLAANTINMVISLRNWRKWSVESDTKLAG